MWTSTKVKKLKEQIFLMFVSTSIKKLVYNMRYGSTFLWFYIFQIINFFNFLSYTHFCFPIQIEIIKDNWDQTYATKKKFQTENSTGLQHEQHSCTCMLIFYCWRKLVLVWQYLLIQCINMCVSIWRVITKLDCCRYSLLKQSKPKPWSNKQTGAYHEVSSNWIFLCHEPILSVQM